MKVRSVVPSTLLPTLCLLLLAGCNNVLTPQKLRYENGVYRGTYIDKDTIEINVEFTLIDGKVTEAKFRHLKHGDAYTLQTEEEPFKSIVAQYRQALEYLIGKDLQTSLADLYSPANVVTLHVDGFSTATLRTNKIISAVRDALNRGVYKPVQTL